MAGRPGNGGGTGLVELLALCLVAGIFVKAAEHVALIAAPYIVIGGVALAVGSFFYSRSRRF